MDFSKNSREHTNKDVTFGSETTNELNELTGSRGITSFSYEEIPFSDRRKLGTLPSEMGTASNESMPFPGFDAEVMETNLEQQNNGKNKRSAIIWVTLILCLVLIGTVTFGIKTFYYRESVTSTASLNKPVDSFWERSDKVVFAQPETKIETGNAVLSGAELDPQSSYIVTNKKVYKMEKGYLVSKGDLPAEYATRRLIKVFDSIAMFAAQTNSVNPFLDLETLRPVNRPKNAKVIDPVGIYNHDLLVARIQKEINGKTTTIGFNPSGEIIWEYDSYCQGDLNKRPQLLMLENCSTGEKKSKFFRRFLDVRNGNTKDVVLSENEYVKVADDHIYLVDVGNKSARYFDNDLTLVPAGGIEPMVLTGDNYRTNEYEVNFQTFSLADRMEALNQIKKMISGNKNKDEKPIKPKQYIATAGAKIFEINDAFKCKYPYFVSEDKKYLCGVSYHDDVLEIKGYTVFNSTNHEKILSSGVQGVPVRFNKGLALLGFTGESKDVAHFYLLK